MAKLLQSSKVGEPVAEHAHAERAKILRTFLQTAPGAESFLAIPGFQNYAPQSGQIFGILKQMKETFEVTSRPRTTPRRRP